MFKILHARLQHYANQEFPDVQAGFRKAEGPEIKLPAFADHRESKVIPEKHLSLIHYTKALTVWIITNCGKLLKKWEYQTILHVS